MTDELSQGGPERENELTTWANSQLTWDSQLTQCLGRTARAIARAARAGGAAEWHESRADGLSPRVSSFHTSMAALHRRAQERHVACIALQWRWGLTIAQRTARLSEDPADPPPRFIDTLALTAQSAGVCIDLRTDRGARAVMASDSTARWAHDLEEVLGEGPVHSCERGGPLLVRDGEIGERWSRYGALLETLDVRGVAAVPLKVGGFSLGSLTAYGTSTHPIIPELGHIRAMGHAVVDLLLTEPHCPTEEALGLAGEVDCKDQLHQAAGMVSVHQGCSVPDALALLRARAFAADMDLSTVVQAVLRGEMGLSD